MGEIFKPGVRIGRDLAPEVHRRTIEELRRISAGERKIALKCMLCGEVFLDPIQAYLHQLEHEKKGENACFKIIARIM